MSPSLEDLSALAKEGRMDELLLGLCKRVDAASEAKYTQAVASFDFLTDHPKKTVTEARLAGEISGAIPETPDYLAELLIEVCRQRWAR